MDEPQKQPDDDGPRQVTRADFPDQVYVEVDVDFTGEPTGDLNVDKVDKNVPDVKDGTLIGLYKLERIERVNVSRQFGPPPSEGAPTA